MALSTRRVNYTRLRTQPVISEILGHSSTKVTEMYSHLSPEVMDRAMEETFGGGA
jgi:integrase